MRFKEPDCKFVSPTLKMHPILVASHTQTSKLIFSSSFTRPFFAELKSVRINSIFHDWVLENTNTTVPPSKSQVTSPFQSDLAKAGYVSDEDTDDEFFS